jgi:hypothetical protein
MLIPEKNPEKIRVRGEQNAYFLFARTVILGFIIAFLLLGLCFAQGLETPSTINSPENLAGWLAKNFRYELKLTDAWQTPQETVSLKKGDCDDFALLAQAVLKKLGIKSDVVIIKFRGLNVLHAICIWKDKTGLYSFISNCKLTRTGKADIQQAIAKFYPDVKSIIYTDQNMRFTKTTPVIIASLK